MRSAEKNVLVLVLVLVIVIEVFSSLLAQFNPSVQSSTHACGTKSPEYFISAPLRQGWMMSMTVFARAVAQPFAGQPRQPLPDLH